MTIIQPSPDDLVRLTAEAYKAAALAARSAGVVIRSAEDNETFERVQVMINTVWQPEPSDVPVTRGLLAALVHAGNYGAVAFDILASKDDHGTDVVGASVGFLGLHPGPVLHSHITGIVPTATRRHIGRALKLHQRAWALERGLSRITWTYDPLVRRNAFFNAARLSALPSEYLVDFYGVMHDAINAGQGSDRLLCSWDLSAPAVLAAAQGHFTETTSADLLAAGARTVVSVVGDRPEIASGWAEMAVEVQKEVGILLVQVPEDIEQLRKQDPAIGVLWRTAIRETLGAMLPAGWRVLGVTRDGYYQLTR